jgi:CRP/FNR family cyclic AMP-dependent transcriptional regulator
LNDDFLAQLPWLSELDEGERALLRHAAVGHTFQTGATVFEPAATPASVYILETGRVRIYRLSAGGEEATLGYVVPGEVFGELPGFGAFPRESFASAQGACRVWKLPVELFRNLVRTHPDLGVEVTGQIAERLKRVESRVESLILRDVRSRLAAALLELTEHFGNVDGEIWTLALTLSQAEMGTLIGASRQSVNTAMAALRQEGWIRQEGPTLILLRPDLLREEVRSPSQR